MRRYRHSPLFASPASGHPGGGGIDFDSMDMDGAASGWEEFGGEHNLDSGGSPYAQFKVSSIPLSVFEQDPASLFSPPLFYFVGFLVTLAIGCDA
jgi:hypothetical protein